MPIQEITANHYRLARRLLREAERYQLTSIELRSLKAVILSYEDNSVISRDDIEAARRLFKVLARNLV